MKNLMIILFLSLVMINTAFADIAVIVSKTNNVVWDKTRTMDQVKDIFLGKKEKFPNGASVKPIDQSEGLSTRHDFYLKLTGKDESDMNAYWSNLIFTGNGRPPQVVGDDRDVKKFIETNAEAIGYIDSKSIDGSIQVILTLK